MKTFIFASLFLASVVQAAPTEKLVCTASGLIQNIMSVVVVPTDLTGQICAISTDRSGRVTMFSSNGSVRDPQIFVKTMSWGTMGEYAVYLMTAEDLEGKIEHSFEEWFTCDELDQEFCTPERRKKPEFSKSEHGLSCELVTN